MVCDDEWDDPNIRYRVITKEMKKIDFEDEFDDPNIRSRKVCRGCLDIKAINLSVYIFCALVICLGILAIAVTGGL